MGCFWRTAAVTGGLLHRRSSPPTHHHPTPHPPPPTPPTPRGLQASDGRAAVRAVGGWKGCPCGAACLPRATYQPPGSPSPLPCRMVDGKKVRFLKKTGEVLPERIPERKPAASDSSEK